MQSTNKQYTFEWTITYIWPIETVWYNALQKRTVVLEQHTDSPYKDTIAVDLLKEKTTIIDMFHVGDVITMFLNFKTNYSTTSQRYFNSIYGWRIEPILIHHEDDDMPF